MATKAGPKRTTRPATGRRRSRKSAAAAQVVELRGSLAHPTAWTSGWSSQVSPDVAARVTSIFGVVRWISQAVAVCPLQLMRELPSGRRERAVLPVAYTLRKRPNAWQSAFDFYGLQAYWTALHGNGYARVVSGDRPWFDEGDPRRRGGWCSQLLPMHPSRVKVEQLDDYTLAYQFLNARGEWELLTQDQVLHWRWISDNGIVGHAPAEMCSTSINLARKLDIAATAFWDNSARPDMYLQTTERIPDEAVAAMRSAVRDTYGGAKNRGSVALLPKGVTLHAMESNSMEAAQFSELRAEILPEVCRHWGVPSTLLGDAKMAKYSTVEQEHLSAQVWCLLPWARRMESPIDMAVQRVHGEDFYCKLDTRGVLRGDASSRASLYQALWGMGAITPNEIRDREDLELIDDPAADQTYLQLGFSTLAAAAAQAGAAGVEPQPQPLADQANRFASGQPRDPDGKFASGGGGGGANGGGANAAGPAEPSLTAPQRQRKERLRDRIEGTQAEADREVKKAQKKVDDLKRKISDIQNKLAALNDPQAFAKQVYADGIAKAAATKEAKIAAAKAKYDAKMKEIAAKYGKTK